MAKQTEAGVMKRATRLLTGVSYAIDAAFDLSKSYPEPDRAYVQFVLRDLRKDLADALSASRMSARQEEEEQRAHH